MHIIFYTDQELFLPILQMASEKEAEHILDGISSTVGLKIYFLHAWKQSFMTQASQQLLVAPRCMPSEQLSVPSQDKFVTTKQQNDKSAITSVLTNVLATHTGQRICKYYAKHNCLDESVRKDMTDAIVKEVFENNIQYTAKSVMTIIKNIVDVFPTESQVYDICSFAYTNTCLYKYFAYKYAIH